MFQPRGVAALVAVALVCAAVALVPTQNIVAQEHSEAPTSGQEISAQDVPVIDEAPLLQEGRDESVFRFQGAPAEGAAEAAGDGGNTRAFGIGDLLRMVLVLLLVIGAVYGIISFLRRRVPHVRTEEDSPLRLLASRDLGTNTWLYAVMVGREVLLLGGGEGSLQLISRVEDQETIDELVLAGSQKTAKDETPPSFGVLLGRLAGNAVAPGNGTAAQPPRSFLAAQQERLRKMRR